MPLSTLAATTYTWTGAGTSPNWSDANNWSPAGIPANDDSVSFSTAATTSNDLPAGTRLQDMTFGSGTSAISGNAIELAHQLIAQGTVNLIAPLTVNATPATIDGTVSLSGSLAGTGIIEQRGLLKIGGSNTFSGTVVADGTLALVNADLSSATIDSTLGGKVTGGGTVKTLRNVGVSPDIVDGCCTDSSIQAQDATLTDFTLHFGSFGQFETLHVSNSVSASPGATFHLIADAFDDAFNWARSAGGGSIYVLVNDGPSPTRAFAGLPEGSWVWINNAAFALSYVGGDGNDVTLQLVAFQPVIQQITVQAMNGFAGSVTASFPVTDGSVVPFPANGIVSIAVQEHVPDTGIVYFNITAGGNLSVFPDSVTGYGSNLLYQLPPGSYAVVAYVNLDPFSSLHDVRVMSFTLDVQDRAPPETTLTGHAVSQGTLTAQFSGVDDFSGVARFDCRMDGGAYAPCTSGSAFHVADGSHVFEVRAVDGAGNADPTPATFAFTSDGTAPQLTLPLLTTINTLNVHAFSLAGTCSETGVAVSVSIVAKPFTWSPVCSAGAFSLAAADMAALADGTYAIQATQTDASGNTGSAFGQVFKRTSVPTVTIDAPATIVAANQAAYSVSGSCSETGRVVKVQIGSVLAGAQCGTPAASRYTVVADVSGLAQGSIPLVAFHSDAAGNTGTATSTAQKHSTGPTTTLDALDPIGGANQSSYGFSGTCDASASRVTYSFAASVPLTGQLDCGVTGFVAHGIDVSSLADGTVTLTLTQGDSFGNVTTVTGTALKDSVNPSVTLDPPAPIVAANVHAFPLTGTCSEAGRTVVIAAGAASASAICGGFGAGAYGALLDVSALADGTVTFSATLADAAGNQASATASATKDTCVAPANGSLTPNPTSLDFGGQSLHTTSLPLTVTFTNTGSTTVQVTSVVISKPFGAPLGPFAQSNDCATLAPAASCTVSLAFTPGSVGGPLTSNLIVAYDASGSLVIHLQGTGESSLITHLYQSVFGRNPDAAGKTFWESEIARMQADGASANDVAYTIALQFFGSSEYLGRHTTDAQYVADLYDAFFNRAGDAAGVTYWMQQLAQGLPRDALLFAFMYSPEFASFTQAIYGPPTTRPEMDLVMGFYREILGRLPDDGGLAYWVGRLRTAECTGASAVTTEADTLSLLFIGSAEYTARGRTNAQFVSDLYGAFMRRGADLPGWQYWHGQLDAGALTRDQLRQVFVSSAEFQARVAAMASAGCMH